MFIKKYKEKAIADILETILYNILHLLSVKMKMLLRGIFSHPMRLCHYLVQGKIILLLSLGLECHTFICLNMERDCKIYISRLAW